ncbi:uncharacterized protein LOC125718855 [Brienomyrus brachyistius]|uniref:uncharacterized protein LOC125718855 n=1 Tax=Brienomyrus brachyistius TaxID=42636 RepID=UPI0020B1D531|nr:uncharacterized protein LOC125718855 [Brienomyrus brachyistius]
MGTPTRGEVPHSSTCQQLPQFSFSRKKAKAVRGKLRMKSPPGILLMLGAVVVMAGMIVAVAGYWPHRAHRTALLSQASAGTGLSGTQATKWGQGARGMLTVTSLVHHTRMRLLGPVIMGVGLFILICANTVLYENRDRETRLLLAQTRGPTRPISTTVPPRGQPCNYHWFTKLTVADLNVHHLGQQAKSQAGGGGSYMHYCVQTEAPPQRPSSPPTSTHPSKASINMLTVEFHLEPRLKLNESMGESAQDDGGMKLMAPTGGSYSLCRNILPVGGHIIQNLADEGLEDVGLQDVVDIQAVPLEALPREPGSVNADRDCSLAESTEERKHRSWPPLRLSTARRYWGLENKQESLDELLD